MKIQIILTILIFVFSLFSTPIMAFSLKKKSEEAFTQTLISGTVFSVLALVLMVVAILANGEPLIAFALSCLVLLICYQLALVMIIKKINDSNSKS